MRPFPYRLRRGLAALLLISQAALAATPPRAAKPPRPGAARPAADISERDWALLEPDGPFYVRFQVDGDAVNKPLYRLGGSYDHAVLEMKGPGSPQVEQLRLEVGTMPGSTRAESIELWLHQGFELREGATLRREITGMPFCGWEGATKDVPMEGFYRVATPRTVKRPYDFGPGPGRGALFSTDANTDAANTLPDGYQSQAPNFLGTYEGHFEITAIDTARHILEGRFAFDAARVVSTHRGRYGNVEAMCGNPSHFKLQTVRITGGEFRIRYCLSPMDPSNSRYCPPPLSPESR
ncbi:hypothetical protein QRD43_03650 [Pelomonas sp. APW6]|uniref:Uncharacterized protein n=1 Tax=Roseateles subflavus TaxID=3053353 RepID=A0ABT7LDQ9_9BURK|nr:hypothetical protein [Pelomonas sp. APW6]MDL5030991.1 hypothetical protein [Pelomonas sp. APW6]